MSFYLSFTPSSYYFYSYSYSPILISTSSLVYIEDDHHHHHHGGQTNDYRVACEKRGHKSADVGEGGSFLPKEKEKGKEEGSSIESSFEAEAQRLEYENDKLIAAKKQLEDWRQMENESLSDTALIDADTDADTDPLSAAPVLREWARRGDPLTASPATSTPDKGESIPYLPDNAEESEGGGILESLSSFTMPRFDTSLPRLDSFISDLNPLSEEVDTYDTGVAGGNKDLAAAAVNRSRLLREHVALESMLLNLEQKILDTRKRIYFPEYMHNVSYRRSAISRAHLVALNAMKDKDKDGRDSLDGGRRRFNTLKSRSSSMGGVGGGDDSEAATDAADTANDTGGAKVWPLTMVKYDEGVFFGIQDFWLEAFSGEFELSLQSSMTDEIPPQFELKVSNSELSCRGTAVKIVSVSNVRPNLTYPEISLKKARLQIVAPMVFCTKNGWSVASSGFTFKVLQLKSQKNMQTLRWLVNLALPGLLKTFLIESLPREVGYMLEEQGRKRTSFVMKGRFDMSGILLDVLDAPLSSSKAFSTPAPAALATTPPTAGSTGEESGGDRSRDRDKPFPTTHKNRKFSNPIVGVGGLLSSFPSSASLRPKRGSTGTIDDDFGKVGKRGSTSAEAIFNTFTPWRANALPGDDIPSIKARECLEITVDEAVQLSVISELFLGINHVRVKDFINYYHKYRHFEARSDVGAKTIVRPSGPEHVRLTSDERWSLLLHLWQRALDGFCRKESSPNGFDAIKPVDFKKVMSKVEEVAMHEIKIQVNISLLHLNTDAETMIDTTFEVLRTSAREYYIERGGKDDAKNPKGQGKSPSKLVRQLEKEAYQESLARIQEMHDECIDLFRKCQDNVEQMSGQVKMEVVGGSISDPKALSLFEAAAVEYLGPMNWKYQLDTRAFLPAPGGFILTSHLNGMESYTLYADSKFSDMLVEASISDDSTVNLQLDMHKLQALIQAGNERPLSRRHSNTSGAGTGPDRDLRQLFSVGLSNAGERAFGNAHAITTTTADELMLFDLRIPHCAAKCNLPRFLQYLEGEEKKNIERTAEVRAELWNLQQSDLPGDASVVSDLEEDIASSPLPLEKNIFFEHFLENDNMKFSANVIIAVQKFEEEDDGIETDSFVNHSHRSSNTSCRKSDTMPVSSADTSTTTGMGRLNGSARRASSTVNREGRGTLHRRRSTSMDRGKDPMLRKASTANIAQGGKSLLNVVIATNASSELCGKPTDATSNGWGSTGKDTGSEWGGGSDTCSGTTNSDFDSSPLRFSHSIFLSQLLVDLMSTFDATES
jgi:hypothetical protein